MAEAEVLEDADARRLLKADLERFNCRVSQPDDPPLFTSEPKPDMQSLHWRGSDLMPLLERIGREVQLGSKGPRRTLRLSDPKLPYGTTTSLWASIQVILPGEVATAHRHSANAFRFVMKGQGTRTTVEGESYPMNEGDLVLTPAFLWHDHINTGDETMIWLDILDISLMRQLRATFFESYPDSVQKVLNIPDKSLREYGSGLMAPPNAEARFKDKENPLLAYTAEMALAALEQASILPSDPHDDTVLEYRNPVFGGPAVRTMSMQLQHLRPGFQGRAKRHTGSKLYYVVAGSGQTKAGDKVFDWTAGDFFTVAPWDWHSHSNSSGERATLFHVSDTPVHRALGYYKEELK